MTEAGMAPSQPQTLDDVMIAMDVVDTLRHREDLVRRELNEDDRESELLARLRQIYRDQGIEVPDGVLAEGVKALEDSRFVYTPPPPGWKRTLLTLWAKRHRHGRRLGIAAAALVALFGGYYALVTRPAKLAKERARIEVTVTLPKQLRQAYADLGAITADADARQKANALQTEAERAIGAGDRAGMLKITAELAALREEVMRQYTLTIVSRPGESSGVGWRPPHGSQGRNYYLIVEAITPQGEKLSLPIRNEETGSVETVSKFGVRVPQDTFETIGRDKRDDGIVQKNRFGEKRRGMLAINYEMPFEGGFITRW
jgi:Family of unknown function (DUF6384)